MSHPVHLTFRAGEEITLEKIARARRDLARNRVPMSGNTYEEGLYWVMVVVDPEHEYALRDMQISGWPAFRSAWKKECKPVLPDEIGQIMGFRVVAGW